LVARMRSADLGRGFDSSTEAALDDHRMGGGWTATRRTRARFSAARERSLGFASGWTSQAQAAAPILEPTRAASEALRWDGPASMGDLRRGLPVRTFAALREPRGRTGGAGRKPGSRRQVRRASALRRGPAGRLPSPPAAGRNFPRLLAQSPGRTMLAGGEVNGISHFAGKGESSSFAIFAGPGAAGPGSLRKRRPRGGAFHDDTFRPPDAGQEADTAHSPPGRLVQSSGGGAGPGGPGVGKGPLAGEPGPLSP